jgi:hypothetical protein
MISKWWARQHGRQLGYAAAASGAMGILFLLSAAQILFLQGNTSPYDEFTGLSIGLGVFSAIMLLIILPEFMTLRGHALLLEELRSIDSTSELRRRKAEGDESADALGAGHDASWTAFLESKGLRR